MLLLHDWRWLEEGTGEDLSDFVDIQWTTAVSPSADLDVSGPFQRLSHTFGLKWLARVGAEVSQDFGRCQVGVITVCGRQLEAAQQELHLRSLHLERLTFAVQLRDLLVVEPISIALLQQRFRLRIDGVHRDGLCPVDVDGKCLEG